MRLRILTETFINGDRVKAGTELTLDGQDARALIARGMAVPIEAKPQAPAQGQAPAGGKPEGGDKGK